MLKKVWKFLWESDSILSLIVDLILIFLIVKFIIFPFLSLLLAPLPFVIIESGSMHHEGSFDQWYSLHGSWYAANNISLEEIKTWPWLNGLDKGDLIIVRRLKDYSYKKGDVIIFKTEQQKTPTIHRIVKIEKNGSLFFSTKGDYNDGQLPYEISIKKEQIIGKAIARIPKVGWIKLFFVELLKNIVD